MAIVNFVRFVSRDGLTKVTPYGKPREYVQPKAFLTLQSSLLVPGSQDTRPQPQPDDIDFKQRTRAYFLTGIDQDEKTGITTAVYLEE